MNNTPQLRFPGKNMSWDNKVLGEVIDVIKGQQVNNSELTSDSTKFPMLNGGSSISGYYIKSNTPANSITISEGGNSCGFVNCMKMDFWAGGHCYIVKPLIDINNEFLFQVLKYMEPEIMKLRVGSGLPNIQRKSLLNEIYVDIPTDPAEQQKIAECLSALDDLISAQGEKVDALKTRKKGLMQQLFPQNGETTPRLRFPGFTGEWSEKKLGEIGDTYSGLSGKTKEDFDKGESKFVTFMNVLKNVRVDMNILGVVDIKTGEKQNKIEYGDMLFNTSSETPEEVGFCSVFDSKTEDAVYLNSFCFGYRFKDIDKHNPLFMAYYLRSSYGRELMHKLAQGITRFNLSKEYFNKANVCFPSPEEQQKIASCLSALDDLIASESAELEALKAHKKGLMQQLFPEPAK